MDNFLTNQSKYIVLTLCFIILLFSYRSYAGPNQRIIVYFSQPVTMLNKIEMHDYLKNLLQSNYSLTEHSNDVRWVVILNSPLNSLQLENIKNSLLKHTLVKHVEIDKLLEKKVTINAQLLSL